MLPPRAQASNGGPTGSSAMNIIDRYLLRHFLQTFVICFLSLMGLIVIIDVTTNLQEFVRCGSRPGSGGVLRVIAQHWGCQSIVVFDVTSGFLALVSAMFTASWIQRHNEMTALMAAGVTRIRVVLPIIIAVIVVSVLSTLNRELVMPRYIVELSRKSQDLLGERPQKLDTRYDNETGVLLAGKHALAGKREIVEPRFMLPPRSPLSAYGTHLTGESAYYVPYIASSGDRSGGYLFMGVHEPRNLDSLPSLPKGGPPVLITPHDAPDWLEPDQCFLKSQLDFDQLRSVADFKKLASTAQLIAALRNPSLDYGADVRVAIHSRITRPLLDITLLFLGLPLVLTRESRNVFVAMGLCIALSALFMLVVSAFQVLGESYLWIPPARAAWAPLMIFVPTAVWLSESMWK